MSDQSREQLFVAATTASAKKNPSSLSKPTHLDSQHSNKCSQPQPQQQTSNKLLTSSSSTSKYLSIELNNNSIIQQPSSSERATSNWFPSESLKTMDSALANKNQQQQPQPQPQSRKPEVKVTNGAIATSGVGNPQTPSYTSIFTSPSYNRSISPPQEIQQQQQRQQKTNQLSDLARRGSKLRKQGAEEKSEIPAPVSVQRSVSHKKLLALEFADSDDVKRAERDHDVEDDDDDDEYDEGDSQVNQHYAESDDLGDEKQPFRSSCYLAKVENSKGRKNLASVNHRSHSYRCQLVANENGSLNKKATSRRSEFDNSHKTPHAKISFSESRPPSFGTCQAAFDHYHHHEAAAKLNGRDIPAQFPRCNCTKCNLKLKASDMSGCSTIQMDPCTKAYTRTKSLHLVLKSIILVLLTLLLLMMFIGIIMATHYLPSVFDKVLNASRSFNVTIAGR